jgi:hypothetical protein
MTTQRYCAHTCCFFAHFLHIAIEHLLTEKVMYVKTVKEQKPFTGFFSARAGAMFVYHSKS